MRDTLIGLSSIVILFGLVWFSQHKATNSKSITKATGNNEIEQNYLVDVEDNNIVESQMELIDPCTLCNEESNMSDDFTFGEAFKFCRQCTGDDGVFMWDYKLYSTKTKSKSNEIISLDKIINASNEEIENSDIEVVNIEISNLVDKEATESIPPPK